MTTMEHFLFSIGLSLVNIAAMAYIIYRYVPRQLRSFAEQQEKWQQINNLCNELIAESTVERALVLRLTNGGGEPIVGTTYYVSVMASGMQDVKTHLVPEYKKLEVDDAYVAMIVGLKKMKRMLLLVDSMPHSLLRDLYNSEKVKYAEVYYLCSTSNATYFCSFATYSEIQLQPSWGDMRRTVSEIRRLLREAYPGAK